MSSSDIKISAGNLADTIEQMMQETITKDKVVARKCAQAGAKKSVDYLKNNSPQKTGVYRKGWKSKEKTTEGGTTAVVYQSRKPQLTHLLELGHGGKAPAPAHPHIAQAYQQGKTEMLNTLKRS